jgi:hypothetical protein
MQVNGACGSSNGQNLLSAPTSNLCSAGTASTVTGAGPWSWTCAGSNGGTTASCSANLEDFSLSPVSPITATAGGPAATATVTVNAINGFSVPVTLTVSGVPTGVSAAFNPVSVNPSGSAASSTLTVSLAPSVTPSTFTLQITGTSGQLTHSTSVGVTVILTTNGITSLINQLRAAGCIDNSIDADALIIILSGAQKAISNGDIKGAIVLLDLEVGAIELEQGLKQIKSSCTVGGVTINPAPVLTSDVKALIGSL